jgi:hypothetical protein
VRGVKNLGKVRREGTNMSQLDDVTMAYSLDASSEPAASLEEVVSVLKELREALEHDYNLASEENSTVDAFLETLQIMSLPISRITIDPSLLPDWLGPIEDARINAEGVLIVTSSDGGIETVNLTSFDNRDLLVSILGELMEKLKGIADGTQVLPELPGDEPDTEIAVIDEAVIEEPQEIVEVSEPEPPEELSPPAAEIDEPTEELFFVEPEPLEPPIEAFSPPPPEPVEYEPPPVSQEVEEPILVPYVQSNSVLRRFRNKVLRQRGEDSRSISEIRRLREAQVQRMRTGANEPWIQEETGVLASLKKLLSRKSGKR